jgi:carboxymethylenebutenolidase
MRPCPVLPGRDTDDVERRTLAYDVLGTDRGNDLKFTKETSAFDSDARAGLDYLAGHARCTGRLGVMGICLGGHLAFRAAMNPGVLAAACFYATDIDTGTLGRATTASSAPATSKANC